MKTAEPEVKIINHTQDALELLIYTKSGRLATGTKLKEIKDWSYDAKMDHLDYMLNTIKSSFEFVDYTFEIKNVSRAFTHQLVRTRTASFQQQAMRVVDARDFSCLKTSDNEDYGLAINYSLDAYGRLIDKGIPVQDARGVLPTAIHTSIIVKANLRTLSQMAELRLCKRAEGEYQKVFKMMVEEVISIHPWAAPMLKVYCVKTGLCAFPRYDKCPIQKLTINHIANLKKGEIEFEWNRVQHVANPVANKDGMTM